MPARPPATTVVAGRQLRCCRRADRVAVIVRQLADWTFTDTVSVLV